MSDAVSGWNTTEISRMGSIYDGVGIPQVLLLVATMRLLFFVMRIIVIFPKIPLVKNTTIMLSPASFSKSSPPPLGFFFVEVLLCLCC